MPGDSPIKAKAAKPKVRRLQPAKAAQKESQETAPLGACFSDRWTSVVRQLRATCIEANQESVGGLRTACRELRDIFGLIEAVIGADPLRKLAKSNEKFARRCSKIQSLDQQIQLLDQIVDQQWDPKLLESLKEKQVHQVARLHEKVQAENLEGLVSHFELLQALVVAAYDNKHSSTVLNPYFESVSAAQKFWEQLDFDNLNLLEKARLHLEKVRSQATFLQELGLLDTSVESVEQINSLFQASGQLLEIENLLRRAERSWAKKAPNREHQLKLIAKLSKNRQQQSSTLKVPVSWSGLLKVRS